MTPKTTTGFRPREPVRDLDAFVAEAADRGASGDPIEPVGDAGRKASYADPDGNLISFIEVVAPAQS
jgi:hypothetical protein